MSAIKHILTPGQQWSPLTLRLPLGVIFTVHGAQKLFGVFGGYGLEGTSQWMASIGLEPGYFMALAAGSAEFFGGIFLLLGLFTRPTAFVLAITMIVAIFSVHVSNGLFMSDNGYEFALALLGGTISLLLSGAGRLSADRLVAAQLK